MMKDWFSGTAHPQTLCKRSTALMRRKLTTSKKIKKKMSKNVVFFYDDIVNEI